MSTNERSEIGGEQTTGAARRDDCLDGDRAGQFAVLFASHTVGNDPQIYFLSHSEGVFIVLPYPAYVGLGSDVNAEMAAVVHANSLSCILYSVPVVSARRQRSMPGL
jgi:hypothetical protein